MNLSISLLASVGDPIEDLRAQAGQAATSPVSKDLLLVIGIGVFLALLVMIWAAYFRKPRSGTLERAQTQNRKKRSTRPSPTPRTGHRRKSIGEYRQRNPTLSETRGLPPLKSPAPPTNKIDEA